MNNPALWFIASALWWFVAAVKSRDFPMTKTDNFFARSFVILSLIFLISGFIQWIK